MSATPFRLDSACLPVDRLADFEQTIIDGILDLLVVLGPDGRVRHASQMSFALTALTPEHLVGNHIGAFMHYDDLPVFLEGFKATLLSGIPWRFHYRLRRPDDTFAVFESTLNPFFDSISTQPQEHFGLYNFVMTTRPYCNPPTVLMDSYLEHFTTNARLVEQIKLLRSEAETADEEENEETTQCTDAHNEPNSKTGVPSNDLLRRAALHLASDNKRNLTNRAATKLEKASDEGDIGIQISAARLDTIEKTGSWLAKPCAIRKRRDEKPRDHICAQCGTKESPEWRTGSRGKKTLCNACGRKCLFLFIDPFLHADIRILVRWAKASKREALECAATMMECVGQS